MEDNKTYLVATIESSDCESIPVEGGLSFEAAEKMANELVKEHYGVEIIDEDPDNMEPIVLVKTQNDRK